MEAIDDRSKITYTVSTKVFLRQHLDDSLIVNIRSFQQTQQKGLELCFTNLNKEILRHYVTNSNTNM